MENPLLRLRARNNITTRRELARKAQLSYETCTLYEHGVRQTMTDNALEKFSRVLHVEKEQLKEDYSRWRKSLAL